MSTTQIIQTAERLSLLERFQVIEALYASIKREMAKTSTPLSAEKDAPFELITFDLGQEVHADRDEIYAERNQIQSSGQAIEATSAFYWHTD